MASASIRSLKTNSKESSSSSSANSRKGGPSNSSISFAKSGTNSVLNLQSTVISSLSCVGNVRHLYATSVGSNIHCIRFSETSEYLAVGLGSGIVQIFHASSFELLFSLNREFTEVNVPVTCISWRPTCDNLENDENSPTRIKDIFASAFPDGDIVFWHAPTGKKLTKITESDNQIFSVEYSPDGALFASAGSDCHIRIYNENNKDIIQSLKFGAVDQATGHTNRIFCVKWHPKDPDILISSGWDSTIQIWSRAAGVSIRSIFGPHICGDALDFDGTGKYILSGSHSIEKALTLHSLESPFEDDVIRTSISDDKKMTFLYSAFYSPSKKFFLAGGGHGPNVSNELKIFWAQNKTCVGHVYGLPGPLFSAAVTNDDKVLAVGGAFPHLILYSIETANLQDILY